MIDVKDRIPTYPGRVILTPVAGQANTYDMVRADEPIEPGTPINRALFQAFIDDMNAIRQQIDDKIFEMSQRVRVGDLERGTEIGLYENGVLVPFIVLEQNYSTSVRTLVLRKSCVTSDVMINTGEKYYEDCRTDMWLNNEYPLMLDIATRSVLDTIAIEASGLFGSETIYRKVFLLSYADYRFNETSGLNYFSSPERRIATLNGTPINHWTRSVYSSGTTACISVDGTSFEGNSSTLVAGIRPAFTLPPDFEVTVGLPSTENVMATAEVI